MESLFTAFGWKEIREEYWKGKCTVLFCLFDWRESADKKRREKRDKGLKDNTILRDVSTFHPICVETGKGREDLTLRGLLDST